MAHDTIYDRLAAGVNLDDDSQDAGIRCMAQYAPLGGWDSKIYPAVYPGEGRDAPARYLTETRYVDGVEQSAVVVDSRQSQANRCEEALQAAVDAGVLPLPHLRLDVASHGREHRITSLTAPHRSRDAYFRDATTADGTPFDATEAGQALRIVTPDDATPLLLHSPADLIFGSWDSQRSLRQATKFPRVYTSETIALDIERGHRAAGRADLIVSGAEMVISAGQDNAWTLAEKSVKGAVKLSTKGHGSIPPSVVETGGVSCRQITRTATLGFAGIARLRFASLEPAAARAARTLLAALALAGDRLAFARPGIFLRSGCELVLESEALAWVGGSGDALSLDRAAALDLTTEAAARLREAGVIWDTAPIHLRPGAELQKAIDRAFFSQPAEED
jgi:CRISPR-associated protein Csb1